MVAGSERETYAQGRGSKARQGSSHEGVGAPLSIDEAAHEALVAQYGERAQNIPPVAIVIAAYNEEGGIGQVLARLPTSLCGLSTAAIVIVDGATDATAAAARRHGVIVCEVPVKRGQGAALRLGYRIARAGGARFIVTTDADGQYDATEAERLLAPIVSGEVDFASGSRVLGEDQTSDRVRRLGVRVFATIISVLTGHRITDPAFGLRAMRSEVTAALELEQPQYQAAEVLIGVLCRGFRATERPATMHRRPASTSKKGGNAIYGWRFARVIASTWWRERRCAARSHLRGRQS